ncbi:SRPBCC domain-containing protein [Roseateles sp.]|uniref:SRPBCC family protein n=1 Tax=Roseateles sp. TaxID=1971397 RepID=UPI0025DD7136|nr:SRPBCC domain-containing protein [Roseateles sp.]MBV8037126.1 SRPBCC domain-containing protein [Roseateles sp.]
MADKLSAPFVLERRFAAPRELVYAALTEAEHLAHWMTPPGMEMTHCSVDARAGGVFHYAMKPRGVADAPSMWGKWTFRELRVPERIVVVVQFSDAEGGVTRHPMAAQWPLYTLSTTTLTEVAGDTLMRLEWHALDASEAEEAIFNASHASMAQGWGGSMELLDRYLAQLLGGQG